ncbi:beta-ketoacyl-ACP synthase III [Streptococcus halichoeri]|uniref:beta-ketoacyl-ACP synthase III n=1 Tax=Streptococcus halichoeri TaxID=254785 RepID=UPI00135A909D|nr:beta-ketoacyl-ACP synthase III [Streptococcus halichoeri]
MPYSRIGAVAHYVPNQVVTNHDLAKIMDTTDDWIRSRTGIEERRITQTENTSDLAIAVAEKLLQQAQLAPEAIDFIIIATMSPDASMPSTAAKVQAGIGASKAFAFDMTAACSGFVFALATADKLIRSGAYQKGLVIGAEVTSKMLDWTDRSTAVLFGDGAGGVLIEQTMRPHFLAESLHTDGSRGHTLTSGASPLASPYSQGQAKKTAIQMEGRAIFDFAVRDVATSIVQLIEQSGLDKNQLDYLLLHQANQRILDKMARKMDLPRAKFLENMMHYGNTSAASIPILMSEAFEQGRLTLDGSKLVLLSGFGGGLTWGTLIVKI